MTLTPKQQRFVEEFLVDSNATQAAIRAGYSAKTANPKGSQLLAKVSVAAAVAEAQAKRRERLEVTVDRITAEYDEARRLARYQENPAVMASTTEKKAKLHGLLVDKFQAKSTVIFELNMVGKK